MITSLDSKAAQVFCCGGVEHSTIETKAVMAGNMVYLCLVYQAINIPDRVSGRWGEKVVRRVCFPFSLSSPVASQAFQHAVDV